MNTVVLRNMKQHVFSNTLEQEKDSKIQNDEILYFLIKKIAVAIVIEYFNKTQNQWRRQGGGGKGVQMPPQNYFPPPPILPPLKKMY